MREFDQHLDRALGDDGFKKTHVGTLWDGTKVFVVDGGFVRDNIDVDFVGGGHHLAHSKIPADEIWVEKMDSLDDTSNFLVHEVIESILMRQGFTYDDAHGASNTVEAVMRYINRAKIA